ncbi:LAMI_0H01244g1_1 [Lachancea mirantina]|uniref:Origin recognition complex subunit 1 n=1 Tax=Lachancea mirantina TaxID=1230905 RepID=A0A1G4KDN4_9SACH|nr:LAMI_0H01244g1_1 [Lachancea mirantina]
MASTLGQLKGWEVVKRDAKGDVITGSSSGSRTSRRRTKNQGTDLEHVSLRRIADNLVFGPGDSIMMRDKGTETYSVHLIHEIRENTLNSVVEIWAFTYLRWFELDKDAYMKSCLSHPHADEESKPSFSDNAHLEHVCEQMEIFLTAELSELKIKNFMDIAIISDSEEFGRRDVLKPNPNQFLVQWACEPNGTAFVLLDIHAFEKKVKNIPPKASEKWLKDATASGLRKTSRKSSLKPPKILREAEKRSAPANVEPNEISHVALDIRSQSLERDQISMTPRETEFSESAGDNSSSEESSEDNSEDFDYQEGGRSNRKSPFQNGNELGRSASKYVILGKEEDEDEEQHEELVEDEFEVDEEEEESLDTGVQLKSSRGKRANGRRSSSERPTKVRRANNIPEPSTPKKQSSAAITTGSSLGNIIKKYTKKNVFRAKKAYTPFSKRFNSTKDIPDLTQLAEFNQHQMDLDLAAIENNLRSPKKQKTVETIFSKVKQQLYTSHGKAEIVKATNFDEYLPARENEFASLYLSLYSAMEAGTGTTVYLAGTPGVGKTLTVREVVKELLQSADQNELPIFQYVEINGLKMIKPSDSYEVLWNKISGERLTSGAAMESLEFYFNKVPKEKKRPVLVLLDELDALVTKSQDVMYNFFNWTTYKNANLVIVAVANTMDLPERQLGNKVSSRIGFTRIMFTGYNHEELKSIINLRLKGVDGRFFYVDIKNGSAQIVTEENGFHFDPREMHKVRLKISPDAVEIASRKIASISGDARRALKACKRAVEIAEHEYMEKHGFAYDGESTERENNAGSGEEFQTVEIAHIMKALNESVNSPVFTFVAGLSFAGKLFLYALVNLIRKSGFQEQNLGDIVDEIKSLIEANGNNKFVVEMHRVLFAKNTELTSEQLRIVSWDFLINQLVEAGIILRQNLKNERMSAVKFDVSVEDVKMAIEQDEVMKTL